MPKSEIHKVSLYTYDFFSTIDAEKPQGVLGQSIFLDFSDIRVAFL